MVEPSVAAKILRCKNPQVIVVDHMSQHADAPRRHGRFEVVSLEGWTESIPGQRDLPSSKGVLKTAS